MVLGFRSNRRLTEEVSLQLVLEAGSVSFMGAGAWYPYLGSPVEAKEQGICSPNLRYQSGSHQYPLTHA